MKKYYFMFQEKGNPYIVDGYIFAENKEDVEKELRKNHNITEIDYIKTESEFKPNPMSNKNTYKPSPYKTLGNAPGGLGL